MFDSIFNVRFGGQGFYWSTELYVASCVQFEAALELLQLLENANWDKNREKGLAVRPTPSISDFKHDILNDCSTFFVGCKM